MSCEKCASLERQLADEKDRSRRLADRVLALDKALAEARAELDLARRQVETAQENYVLTIKEKKRSEFELLGKLKSAKDRLDKALARKES